MACALMAASCYNEKIDFPDFDTQSVYFPYQYPVRTLSLGNDKIDNSLDRQHKFNIGVCVGGYYDKNKRDWRVDYEVAEDIVGYNLFNAAGDRLTVLPREYYTLNPESSVVIPKGSFTGKIEVQLTDAFFEDPQAVKGNYVIPLRIVQVEEPAVVLRGEAVEGIEAPDMHNLTDWVKAPMDYTLFGVKFVNKFGGNWLRRGALTVRDAAGNVTERVEYHADYVEFDEVVNVRTTGMNSFTTSLNIKEESWILDVTADGEDNFTIVSAEDSKTRITYGSGRYKENGDSWGGTPENPELRDALYLDYFYDREDGSKCEVCDTLVFRDRNIRLEVDRPIVK